MSCNGCRVLRKGCSDTCILRSCLHWITTPEAQGKATLFLAKFFGRSDLLSLIAAVPESQRPALFQSLLFEACGRTVNPVNGAVGLLWSGNWNLCKAAVETVLSGGNLGPLPAVLAGSLTMDQDDSSESFAEDSYMLGDVNRNSDLNLNPKPTMVAGCSRGGGREKRGRDTASFYAEESSETTTFESNICANGKKLLNLFV